MTRPPAEVLAELGPCWIWTRWRDKRGYGALWIRGRTRRPYRETWEALNGPVPAGKHLHHLCATPACYNPKHVVPMTFREHMRLEGCRFMWKATNVCCNGHRVSSKDIGRNKDGSRKCRVCERAKAKRHYKPERKRTYNHQYHAAHREAILKRQREGYATLRRSVEGK